MQGRCGKSASATGALTTRESSASFPASLFLPVFLFLSLSPLLFHHNLLLLRRRYILLLSSLPSFHFLTQILKSIRYAFDWYTVCTAITACTGRVCTIRSSRYPGLPPTIIPRHTHPSCNPLRRPPSPRPPSLADARENCSCSCSALQPTWLRG